MRAARICRAALNSRFAYLFTLTLRRFTLTLRRPCKNKSAAARAATHILASTSHAFAYSCRRLSSARHPRKTKAPQLTPQRTYSLPPLTPLPLRTAIAGCLPRAARANKSAAAHAATHILTYISHAFAYRCRRLPSAPPALNKSAATHAAMHILASTSHAFAHRCRRLSSVRRPHKAKAPQLAPQRSVLLRGFGTASAAARLACNRSVRCRLRACPSRRTLRWWVLHRRRAPRPAPTHIRATRRIPTAAHIGTRQSLSLCYHNPLMFASISRLFCD